MRASNASKIIKRGETFCFLHGQWPSQTPYRISVSGSHRTPRVSAPHYETAPHYSRAGLVPSHKSSVDLGESERGQGGPAVERVRPLAYSRLWIILLP